MKKRKIPTRKCILTNEMFAKKDLLRIVKNKEGEIYNEVIRLIYRKSIPQK